MAHKIFSHRQWSCIQYARQCLNMRIMPRYESFWIYRAFSIIFMLRKKICDVNFVWDKFLQIFTWHLNILLSFKLFERLDDAIYSSQYISASCLSYGHSCWGGECMISLKLSIDLCLFILCTAHGKRSYPPQRELKPGEPSDRWALFKIIPERVNHLRLQ